MTMLDIYFGNLEKYEKKYGKKTIFLMQCGSFFEVYSYKNKEGRFVDDKITDFSRICDMTIAKKHGKYKGKQIFMAGFSPIDRIDKYVKILNDNGYVVPVWIQDEKVPSIRKELGIYTPGTSFSLNSQSISNNIMCVWIDIKEKTLLNKNKTLLCGMSCIDVYTGTCNMFRFKEEYFHNPTTFDQLERFYTTFSPNEIIVIYNCSDEKINDIIKFSMSNTETIHKIRTDDKTSPFHKEIINCDKQSYQKELLEMFYPEIEYNNFYEEYKFRENHMATLSFTFLLNFVYSMQPNIVKKIKEPVIANTNDRLTLANHSAKQLNILKTTEQNGRMSSVIQFLNRCKTPMGKRKLSYQILNPSTDSVYLNKEYSIIDYCKTNFTEYENMYKDMTEICDFERFYRKIVLGKITPAEIYQFYNNLKQIKKIDKLIVKDEKIFNYINNSNLSSCYKKISSMIKKNLKLSECAHISTTHFDENIFYPNIDEELDDISFKYCEAEDQLKRIKIHLESHIMKFEKKMKKNCGYVKEHKTEKSGIYFEITKRRSEILKKEMEKISYPIELTYKSSFNGEERKISFDGDNLTFSKGTGNNKQIITSVLTKLYNESWTLKMKLKKHLGRVYKDFVEKMQNFKREINSLISFVTSIDLIFTKAMLAINFNYCRPIINDDNEKSFFDAVDMRHLLIEHLQQDEIYVSNNICLGKDETDGVLLYGTNAIGKSSLIKSIGICVILAQSGFFVPCSSFVYKPYKKIFTRILGNDNIFKGLSTFAVEMSELSVILKNACKDSLVLGDEVCSGTETTSAISIFLSSLYTLDNLKTSFIFATHLHQIVNMPYLETLEKTKLMHMSIYCNEEGVIVYDRKLKMGSGSNIYGLEVCKSLHMPQLFLEKAHEIRKYIHPEETAILSLKTSRYNSNKIKKNCELCGKKAVDIHHMIPQEKSDQRGFIDTFHKNKKANLMNLCKSCHNKETKTGRKLVRKKTNKGHILVEA